ncbi:MAG: dinucleotide-binding enzyme [Pseudopedobacter saltans]|uniref:Dinucleotide-binding enzyme n=1 Tax=Pseudopedobacter saltans TaxID=151895 RepID=A0A2W5F4C9_9SPHI|nr:MAG: dinucleotide-binding enzyme [Pseudopedobacter saltans]
MNMKNLSILFLQALLLVSFVSCGQNNPKTNEVNTDSSNIKTTISIIGSGNVGGTLGKKWAKAGYTVLFSSRHPEELGGLVKEAGSHTKAVSVVDAAKQGNIIVLAVPFKAEAEISKQINPYIKGKTVILCDNAYPNRDGAIANEAKSVGVAFYAQKNYYPAVKLVRAFSSLPVSAVGSATSASPVSIPYAVDDDSLKPIVEKLIKAIDGKPNYIGNIKDSQSLDY